MKHTLLFFLTFYFSVLFSQTPTKPNIIFILADDMNDWVQGFNGQPQTITPTIAAFETAGVTFTNAYSVSPICAPARTSLLSGKDCKYTKIDRLDEYQSDFRANFTAANGNEFVVTLPEHLKNNGYYTYTIGKVFHEPLIGDYDKTHNSNPCLKTRSWNKRVVLEDDSIIKTFTNEGINGLSWNRLPDSLETKLEDYKTMDSAITFINSFAAGTASTCGNPFFLAIGTKMPHITMNIPNHYFSSFYNADFYAEPFDKPYNYPVGSSPYNGIEMPPQPEPKWADYYNLGPVAQNIAHQHGTYDNIVGMINGLDPLPEIDPALTDEERKDILIESESANAVIAYLAAIQYTDAQIGRLYAALQAQPELLSNTIIIFTSDQGFSLGEKQHWLKSTLWEPDIRVPLVIVDPRKAGNKISNRTVSLLDLFPTVCDLTGTPYPNFPDGSNYLDGKSFNSLLTNPGLNLERPVLSTIRSYFSEEGSCFPQYSVRNQRFHYIRWRSNTAIPGDDTGCDEAGSFYEEELYDIGINKETDPNEWNNLIDSSEYGPVKNYLQQFLPDSALYLQKQFTASITTPGVTCLAENDDIIKLKVKLFDGDGVALTSASLSAYQFVWTNSLNPTVYSTASVNFPMSSIPTATYSSGSHIMFYLKVYEIATGKLVAFNTKNVYFNPANFPVANFNLTASGLTVSVTGYNLTGTYNSTSWSFDDGSTSNNFIPGPHTFTTPGMHKVKNIVKYGNGCTKTYSKSIIISSPPLREGSFDFTVYPVPAQDIIYLNVPQSNSNYSFEIINILGEVMKVGEIDAGNISASIDISLMPQGSYFIKLKSNTFSVNKAFEILK